VDVIALPNAGSERVKMRNATVQKKQLLLFKLLFFLVL
jgi:hypothetical protein